MRVLFLFVLALYLSLLGVQVSGHCHSSGTLENSFCNCYAGAAPDYTKGTDNCVKIAGCVNGDADTDTTSGNYAPTLSSTPVKFVQDRITISFVQPIVQEGWLRREAYITFFPGPSSDTTPGDSACSYPGPMWIKSTDSVGCEDDYTFTMAWSNYKICGFQRAATPSVLTYTTTVQFSYNEVSDNSATPNTRALSNLFTINIQLVRQTAITAALNLQVDSPTDANVEALIVGNSAFDLLTGQSSVFFQTQTSWPYQIGSPITTPSVFGPTIISAPASIMANVTPDYLTPDNCPQVAGTTCIQQFEIVITPTDPSVCDLAGEYLVGTQIVCADADSCTPQAGPTVTISLHHTNICAPPVVDTGVSTTQSLLSFSDNDLSNPQTNFETGDISFWTFTIVDPAISIDAVTLDTVTLSLADDPSSTDVIFAVGTAPNPAITNIVQTTNVVHPAGTPIVVSFGLTFNRAYLPNTVQTLAPGNSFSAMNLVVIVDVQYHGNKKRKMNVVVSPASNGMAASTATFVVRAKEHSLISSQATHTMAVKEEKTCTGITCGARSFVRKVMGALGF